MGNTVFDQAVIDGLLLTGQLLPGLERGKTPANRIDRLAGTRRRPRCFTTYVQLLLSFKPLASPRTASCDARNAFKRPYALSRRHVRRIAGYLPIFYRIQRCLADTLSHRHISSRFVSGNLGYARGKITRCTGRPWVGNPHRTFLFDPFRRSVPVSAPVKRIALIRPPEIKGTARPRNSNFGGCIVGGCESDAGKNQAGQEPESEQEKKDMPIIPAGILDEFHDFFARFL